MQRRGTRHPYSAALILNLADLLCGLQSTGRLKSLHIDLDTLIECQSIQLEKLLKAQKPLHLEVVHACSISSSIILGRCARNCIRRVWLSDRSAVENLVSAGRQNRIEELYVNCQKDVIQLLGMHKDFFGHSLRALSLHCGPADLPTIIWQSRKGLLCLVSVINCPGGSSTIFLVAIAPLPC